ncbi:hypothetical protein ACIBCD_13100 [Nocardia brasiliensis]|uniref:hypothetical protein n=2 Tax=Nocardia brasiliensis TaxID=37326 RepID=UPI0037AB737E
MQQIAVHNQTVKEHAMNHFRKAVAASSIVLAAMAGITTSLGSASAAPVEPYSVQFETARAPMGPMRTAVPAILLGVAVKSCAQGALASVAVDVLRDVATGGDQPQYVVDAVVGCFSGAGVGMVWSALAPGVKKKAIAAVVALVIGISPLD